MKLAQYSIDDGATWHDIKTSVKFVFHEANEDDDEMQDLYGSVTHEGIILDLVGQCTGGIYLTAAMPIESLLETLS
jgi:hypothetical protein